MNLAQRAGLAVGAIALAVGGGFGATQLAHTVQTANASTKQQGPGGMRNGPGGMQPPGNAQGAQPEGATSPPATQSGGTASTAPGGTAPGGGVPGGAQGAPPGLVAKVATDFGLDQTKVNTAMTSAFATVNAQNSQPGDAMDSALAKKLAADLGVDETKMKETLVSYRSTMQQQGPAAGG